MRVNPRKRVCLWVCLCWDIQAENACLAESSTDQISTRSNKKAEMHPTTWTDGCSHYVLPALCQHELHVAGGSR